MAYREAEKKLVKHRLLLTRGEVSQIVRNHLVAYERMPKEEDGKTWMAALSGVDGVADPPNPDPLDATKKAPWSDWPALLFEWEEEVPE